MNIHTLHNLQEAYLGVYELDEAHGAWTRQGQSIHDYSSYAQEIGHDDPETRRELRNLRRRKGHGPKIAAHAINKANFDIQRAAGKNPRTPEYRFKKRTQREQAELYDIILSHLLDEGYADCLGSAEIILENMSDEWLDDILEGFVDPDSDDTPSGRRPIDTVAEHPRKKTREKAMKGFVKQMNRNYTGGKFKANVKDPAED